MVRLRERRGLSSRRRVVRLSLLLLVLYIVGIANTHVMEMPKFHQAIENFTQAVGREGLLTCIVDNLAQFKVAWLRVDTQTILTIANHVITKNSRIGVTHTDHRTWHLHIRELQESDRGWYMCQINTDPMKSQVGYLEVVVSPDILDVLTSQDITVREGENVSMTCAAKGMPIPTITWRRETGDYIYIRNGKKIMHVKGHDLNIPFVTRYQMGSYFCIASNGVPPTVSKRIYLTVHFPPMIWIPDQHIGAYEGQDVELHCHVEAFPKAVIYWTNDNDQIFLNGDKYETEVKEDVYKTYLLLRILNIEPSDFTTYKCVSKNSLGDTEQTVTVYRDNTLMPTTEPTIGNELDDRNGAKGFTIKSIMSSVFIGISAALHILK